MEIIELRSHHVPMIIAGFGVEYVQIRHVLVQDVDDPLSIFIAESNVYFHSRLPIKPKHI
jgi:hypothetical protein